MKDNPTLEERYRMKWMKHFIEALKADVDIREWNDKWHIDNPPPQIQNQKVITIPKLKDGQ